MYGMSASTRQRLKGLLSVPVHVRREFLQESLRKNDLSLLVLCGIVFAAELYNIARVLFWSRAGLGTLNNRIYFGLYCALLAVAGLWLLVRLPLSKAAPAVRRAGQHGVIMAMFLWHILLNAYDLYRDAGAGITVITTAALGLSVLIQMSPLCSFLSYSLGYLLFRLLAAPLLPAGERVNLTITFAVALAVSLINAHHTSVHLLQRQQITQMNARLQSLLNLDSLTGLLNKAGFQHQAQLHLSATEKGETAGVTLCIIDLDDFKSVNDRYGHPCGDHVLAQTAAGLREAFPETAELGRIGGDEFAAVLNRTLEDGEAEALKARLFKALGQIRWQEQPIGVSCSMGVCVCTRPDISYDRLYAQADRMLYLAKGEGKGQCCIHRLAAEQVRQ